MKRAGDYSDGLGDGPELIEFLCKGGRKSLKKKDQTIKEVKLIIKYHGEPFICYYNSYSCVTIIAVLMSL